MRFVPHSLNRKLSHKGKRPVFTSCYRFNQQRWLRFHAREILDPAAGPITRRGRA